VAIVLALGASLAGSPYAERHASLDVALMARTVAQEDDHVTAVELARWIRERRPGLRVIDVRSAEEFDAYHLPTAERIPLDSIVRTPFTAGETIVLYSEGGTHAAQAWVFLRALGYRRVYFLRGGAYEWLQDVMNPTISENASAAERAEFAKVAALSRYFGGQPRVGIAPAGEEIPLPAPRDSGGGATTGDGSATAEMVRKIRRRGC
jgi:rhodanese-related sulfurtransferase